MAEKLLFEATLKDNVSSQSEKIGDSFGGLAKKAGLAAIGFISVDKAAKLAYASIEEFKNSELTFARLSATVKAVGDRTAYTSAALQKMATAMQGKTIFGDEAIMGAQQILLTMQNIGDDILPKAIEAAQNMSQTEDDLASKSFALGKALESPAEGFTALKRSGVILGEQAEKQIKSLMDEGRLREAQGILLAEVETRYGGVAEAMAKTAAGQELIRKNQIGDQMERLGEALMPIQIGFTKATAGVISFVAALASIGREKPVEQTSEQIKKVIQNLEDLNKAAGIGDTSSGARSQRITALKAQLAEMLAQEKAYAEKSKKVADDAAKKEKDAQGNAAKDAQGNAAKKRMEESDRIYQEQRAKAEAHAILMAQIHQSGLDEQAEADRKANDTATAEGDAFRERQLALKKKFYELDAAEKKKAEDAKKQYEQCTYNQSVGIATSTADLMGTMANLAKEDAKKMQALRVGQALIDAAAASIAMWRSVWAGAGNPYVAIALGVVSQAGIIASAAASISQINQQKFADGGIIAGPSRGDSVQVRANGGEMMLNGQQQANLFAMANGGTGSTGPAIMIAPNVRVDSSMSASEKQRTIAATAASVRDALLHLVNTNRIPAGVRFA